MHQIISAASLAESQKRRTTETPWSYRGLVGGVVEVSGQGPSAALSATFEVLSEAQHAGELCAWICADVPPFFPPDAVDAGIDLAALAVIQVPSAQDAGRVADKLARSGGLGLIVLDVGKDLRLPAPLLGRLTRLAKVHRVAVICLTEKPERAPSLGAMVSLRVSVSRTRSPQGGLFRCTVRAIKDKRRGPGWEKGGLSYGPSGLR